MNRTKQRGGALLKHHRAVPGVEIRAVDTEKRQVTARVCNYNVADTYGSVWVPGCWSASLERKAPKSVWGHDWTDPIGRVISWDDGKKHLDVVIQLDDPEAVPRAKQAWSQLQSGSIDEWSFGFYYRDSRPVPEEMRDNFGENSAYEYVYVADMVEVSPVLVGSVPGTATTGTRSKLSATLVEKVAVLLENEVISKDEARSILEDADQAPGEDEEKTEEIPPEETEDKGLKEGEVEEELEDGSTKVVSQEELDDLLAQADELLGKAAA